MNKEWSLLYANIFNDDSLCLFTCTAHKVSCVHLQAADVKAAIDDRVVGRINELVDERIFNVGEMKRHVRLFVLTLFGDQSMPHTFNRRFFPSRDDIRNFIYRHRQRQRRRPESDWQILSGDGRQQLDIPSVIFHRRVLAGFPDCLATTLAAAVWTGHDVPGRHLPHDAKCRATVFRVRAHQQWLHRRRHPSH